MKKIKLLTPAITLATVAIPLSGCAKNTTTGITVQFEASEGVTLSGNLSIQVDSYTTWSQLEYKGLIPKVEVPTNYTSLGWCVKNSEGHWKSIPSSYRITSSVTIRYVAYSNVTHPAINVDLDVATLYSHRLDFAANFTFGEFRSYYDIPADLSTEGAKFDGFYKVTQTTNGEELTLLHDNYVFADETIEIRLVWDYVEYTASLYTDGNGTVNPATANFTYGQTWLEIKNNNHIVVTPNTGYEFDKWIDMEGNEIADDTEMTDSFIAIATFKEVITHTVVLAHSEGVTFPAETKTMFQAKEGLTWGELEAAGKIPKPQVSTGYTGIGWFAISSEGDIEEINEDYVISNDIQARYVAYNATTTTTVQIKINPTTGGKYQTLPFEQGGTFGAFRALYGIPDAPSYKGYNFKGYYVYGQTEPIDDTYTFEGEGPTRIEAKYDRVTYTVSLKTDGNGTLSTDKVTVPFGTEWSDVLKLFTVTPNAGYTLEHWYDANGRILASEYQVDSNMTATAKFKAGATNITLLTDSIRSVGYQQAHHQYDPIQWTELQQGVIHGKEGWKDPTFVNHTFKIESDASSSDSRMITGTLQVVVTLPPHTSQINKVRVKGYTKAHIGPHILPQSADIILQLYNLDSATDHPEFYAWPPSNDTTIDYGPKNIFHDAHTSLAFHPFKGWNTTGNYDFHVLKSLDENKTDEPKAFTHFLHFSFIHTGDAADVCSNQSSAMELTFSLETE